MVKKPNTKNLRKFFNLKSIAGIGATEEKRLNGNYKEGKVIFQNLLKSKVKKKVHPVNLKKEKVLGRKCYKSVTEIPGKIGVKALATYIKYKLGIEQNF